MLYRELGDQRSLEYTLPQLVEAAISEGDITRATVLAQESLSLSRELARERGDKGQTANALLSLGSIILYRGDLLQAETMRRTACRSSESGAPRPERPSH
jgi:hypothetical protein